jgi:DNA-binding SARP family transcriptional activator
MHADEILRFAVLGRLTASCAGRDLELGWARQQGVLAALVLRMNQPASVEWITDAVWGEQPPRDARNTVQTNISRLRRLLSGYTVITSTHNGYVLRGDPAELDLVVFERRIATARQRHRHGDPSAAAAELDGALAMWRGEPFAGLQGPLIDTERHRLTQLRLDADELRATIMVDGGHHAEAVPGLRRLADERPLHEPTAALLMVALYRCGQRAEALDVFMGIRGLLADELGLDPGTELRALQERILRADPALDATPPVPAAASRNDLPGDVADFTGRAAELEMLLATDPTPASVVIEALDGMAGVGKTTLAVHAAHRLAASFPDVQLFIDLHGHTSDQDPVSPMAALDALLCALGVPADAIPNDLDARAALWRAELATRRAVLVLDNAGSAGQVRPLLPGTSRCLTVITSRHRLADLETTHTLSLDVLSEQDAMALFGRIVGAERLTGQLAAAGEVISLCGRLPLAVRIAGGRLRSRPAWTVRHLAGRLCQAATPLTELSTGDRSVAAAFTLSYQHLDPAQQRMFRLLGLHPGVLFDAAAAAALTADSSVDAGRLLDTLVDAHLLQEPTAGRYRFHDLLRLHAAATVAAHEPEHVREQALAQLTDFYLHTAYAASRQLDSQFQTIDIGEPAPDYVCPHLPDEAAAMSWFDTNHANMLAVLREAEEQHRFARVWQLAWTLDNYHYRRGHIQASLMSWRAGLAAAERLGDVAVQAKAHRRLGIAYGPAGEHAEAVRHLRLSLTLAERVGDVAGQAGAHFVLALTWRRRDDERVLTHITSALRLYRELGNTQWQIRSLSMLGACEARLGRHDAARVHCETALTLCRQNHDHYGEADSLDSLGALAGHTGQHTTALDHYRAALAAWRNLDNTYRQADTLTAIGETHATMGRPDAVREAWQEAADLYESQGRAKEADRVRRRMATIDESNGVN